MLNREELERELVRFDKQKLITECLKLFDTNVALTERIEAYRIRVRDVEEANLDLVRMNRELKARTWWQMLKKKLRGQ